MLKQKIVMRVDKMSCNDCQKKCRKIAAEAQGCISLAIEAEKGHLIVTGLGIDIAALTKTLNKKVGWTTIETIEILKTPAQKKEDEIKKQAKELIEEEAKKNKNRTLTWRYDNQCYNNYYNQSYPPPPPPPPPPPGYDIVCYGGSSYPNTWFSNW